jgi:hypothetical protein
MREKSIRKPRRTVLAKILTLEGIVRVVPEPSLLVVEEFRYVISDFRDTEDQF